MKKTILLMCLAFGMIVSACKKDDPVTPAVQTGTVTISFKTNKGMTINRDLTSVYSSLLENVDSSIVFSEVTNETRFDLFLLYNKNVESRLQIKYNNTIVADTLIRDTTSKDGTISILYHPNGNVFYHD